MAGLGACVAVIESGKILLTQREDFEVWCLPGGHVESGESAAQAAVREAFEETGLKVELTQLIGVYFRNRGDDGIHIFSFLAKPVGGVLKPQLGEVIDVRYFDLNDLPWRVVFLKKISEGFVAVDPRRRVPVGGSADPPDHWLTSVSEVNVD